MTTAAVVLAGGSGQRAGLGQNKTLAHLGGRSILSWSVATLRAEVDRVVIVARPVDRAAIIADCGDIVDAVVDGGVTRHDSERAGLAAIGQADVVAIHDGARPLLSSQLVRDVLAAASGGAAVVPGLPLAVPVARWPRADLHPVLDTAALVRRRGLIAVQTPQAAPLEVLRAAFDAVERAHEAGAAQLDTVEPVLRHLTDVPVRTVPGDPRNIKITWASDVPRAARLLEDPTRVPVGSRLRRRSGWPTGGAPLAQLEVDGVVPVTDALRRVEEGRVTAAVDRAELVDVRGDLLAVPGTLPDDADDLGLAIERAVADGAQLRLRRRR